MEIFVKKSIYTVEYSLYGLFLRAPIDTLKKNTPPLPLKKIKCTKIYI